jgi:hypothetical protein
VLLYRKGLFVKKYVFLALFAVFLLANGYSQNTRFSSAFDLDFPLYVRDGVTKPHPSFVNELMDADNFVPDEKRIIEFEFILIQNGIFTAKIRMETVSGAAIGTLEYRIQSDEKQERNCVVYFELALPDSNTTYEFDGTRQSLDILAHVFFQTVLGFVYDVDLFQQGMLPP